MEIKIRDKDVLLTTHKTYCEPEEVKGLQAVSQYAPFQKYVADCSARGPAPRAFIVRNIFRFAHRVVGVVLEVEYVDSTGKKLSQTVNLTDQPPAILMPIIQIGDKKYAVLVRQRRLATGLEATDEAITGAVGLSGEFSSDHNEAVEALGFSLSAAKPLPRSYTIGEDGNLAYTIYTTSIEKQDEVQIAELLEKGDGMSPRLFAVPVTDVIRLGDSKAALAACVVTATA
eukprot:gene1854-1133_t